MARIVPPRQTELRERNVAESLQPGRFQTDTGSGQMLRQTCQYLFADNGRVGPVLVGERSEGDAAGHGEDNAPYDPFAPGHASVAPSPACRAGGIVRQTASGVNSRVPMMDQG